MSSRDILASGKFELWKGLRINVWKTFARDYLTAAYYVRVHKWFESLSFINGIENQKYRYLAASVGAAHVAAIMFPIVLTPFEVIKTKVMCEIAPKSTAEYRKFAKLLGPTVMKVGLPGLWTGFNFVGVNSILQNILLLVGSSIVSNTKEVDIHTFFLVNGIVSSILYPIDTVM